MRAAVTGAAGCLGSHLCELLDDKGYEVLGIDNFSRGTESSRNVAEVIKAHPKVEFAVCDILDKDNLKTFLADYDVIFHLAALPSHRLALSDPSAYAEVDIMGTVNVLECSRLLKKQRVVFTSTNKVYGKNPIPFREDDTPHPNGPYGQAKLDAEEWCKLYSEYYDVPVSVTRIFHAIGPRSQPDRELSIFVEQILNNKSQTVHGHTEGGKFTSCAASYTNVYEVVDGIYRASQVDTRYDVFNVGNSVETPVEYLATYAQKVLKKSLPIEHVELKSIESMHHNPDISHTKEILGWEAKVPVEESIKQYIEWRRIVGPRPDAVYK